MHLHVDLPLLPRQGSRRRKLLQPSMLRMCWGAQPVLPFLTYVHSALDCHLPPIPQRAPPPLRACRQVTTAHTPKAAQDRPLGLKASARPPTDQGRRPRRALDPMHSFVLFAWFTTTNALPPRLNTQKKTCGTRFKIKKNLCRLPCFFSTVRPSSRSQRHAYQLDDHLDFLATADLPRRALGKRSTLVLDNGMCTDY